MNPFAGCWTLWLLIWLAAAFRNKRTARRENLASWVMHMLPLAIAAALLLADGVTNKSEIYRFIGRSLVEGHVSLRDDFAVSWPEADLAVDIAIAAGAYGAKMIGGGFGGSVLALMPVEHVGSVRAAVTEAFTVREWTLPEFLDAIPSPAARRLS